MGLMVNVFSALPIEAVLLWLAATYMGTFFYELVRMVKLPTFLARGD